MNKITLEVSVDDYCLLLEALRESVQSRKDFLERSAEYGPKSRDLAEKEFNDMQALRTKLIKR
jgi:hypothetical protein